MLLEGGGGYEKEGETQKKNINEKGKKRKEK
jgi:hypothetical protein